MTSTLDVSYHLLSFPPPTLSMVRENGVKLCMELDLSYTPFLFNCRISFTKFNDTFLT